MQSLGELYVSVSSSPCIECVEVREVESCMLSKERELCVLKKVRVLWTIKPLQPELFTKIRKPADVHVVLLNWSCSCLHKSFRVERRAQGYNRLSDRWALH